MLANKGMELQRCGIAKCTIEIDIANSIETMESFECSSSVVNAIAIASSQESNNSSEIIASTSPLESQVSDMQKEDNDSTLHNHTHRHYNRLNNKHRMPSPPSSTLLTILLTTTLLPLTTVQADENNFNSYWNGEWTASSTNNYECQNCDDAQFNNYDNRQPSDMWVDDNIQQYKAEEYEIIRNVSLALVGLLVLSCCMCYPECILISVTSVWNKICGRSVREGEEDGGGEYVGGKMEGGGKKMKKKRSSKRGGVEEPISGLAANAGVELV